MENFQLEYKKVLKHEKRMGFVFAGLILAFGAVFSLLYFITNQEKNLLSLFLICLGIIGLSYFAAFFINRNINKDLRKQTKIITVEKVEEKRHKKDYEVGSGVLYIPILGDLFPKLWFPKMNEFEKYALVIKKTKYDVTKELFESVNEGDFIEIHTSKYSNILLGFKALK